MKLPKYPFNGRLSILNHPDKWVAISVGKGIVKVRVRWPRFNIRC